MINIKRFMGHSAVKKKDHEKSSYEWAVYSMSCNRPLKGDIWEEGGYEPTLKLARREGKRCKRAYERQDNIKVRYAVFKLTRKRVK